MKTWGSYKEMVNTLRKSPYDILATLSMQRVDMWHAATGVATEAGELLDVIKKTAIYNKPIDVGHVIEELGDLEFYMEQLRQNLNITREEVLMHNMNKLGIRYAAGYSDQAAQQRADKK